MFHSAFFVCLPYLSVAKDGVFGQSDQLFIIHQSRIVDAATAIPSWKLLH